MHTRYWVGSWLEGPANITFRQSRAGTTAGFCFLFTRLHDQRNAYWQPLMCWQVTSLFLSDLQYNSFWCFLRNNEKTTLVPRCHCLTFTLHFDDVTVINIVGNSMSTARQTSGGLFMYKKRTQQKSKTMILSTFYNSAFRHKYFNNFLQRFSAQ